jgi:cellulose biosynthesis protein BcsQ
LDRAATGTHRILLDMNASSAWLLRRMSRMSPTVLVPVAPDMNSVISLQAVERFFQGMQDLDGRAIQPYYVLNQFDASLPLHLDVREVLRRQLGDRLLPSVIRRSPVVSESLAEGMTVVDYAPEAAVAEDYVNVANWLRTISAPATQGSRNIRWSER